MENNNIYPYNLYGKVKEVENNGDKFTLVSALEYVIDDFAPLIGSVEQSHYEDLKYFEVVDVEPMNPENGILDLTWMDKEDVVKLYLSSYNELLKEIRININNLECIKLSLNNGEFNDIKVIVHNVPEARISPMKAVKLVNSFMSEYGNVITRGMGYERFSNVITTIFNSVNKKYGIEMAIDEDVKNYKNQGVINLDFLM